MTKKTNNIAIFGGSFNPPHAGHLAVVEHLLSEGRFDEVWLVPVFAHAFGKELAAFDQRLALLQALVKDLPKDRVKVCAAERDLGKSPSYTFDLITHLKTKHPGVSFTILVGTDAKKDLDRWHRIDELKQIAAFEFLPRKGYEDSPFPQVSSSEIRARLARGEDISGFVPEGVIQYIDRHKLYR